MRPAGRPSWLALGGTSVVVAVALLLHPLPAGGASSRRGTVAVSGAQAGRGAPSGAPVGPQTADSCIHVTRQGDTVSRIAHRHGVSRQRLMQANGLGDDTVLRVGRRLLIPGCQARAPQAAQPARTTPPEEVILARVGPRRLPTRFFVGEPAGDASHITFLWPVEGPVGSGVGPRRLAWHAGVDIKADRGTPIRAAAPGIVSFSGWEPAYGRVVKIEHPHGFRTIYAHNLQNHVGPGDWVEVDTIIGLVGNSGRTTGTHLHFELRRNDLVHDPLRFLSPRDTMVAAVAAPDRPSMEGDR